ncbi:hypothetical protein [Streptomyces sp. SCA2-2]|uniref:hypothetical protein n=1 Tax=Streptomyces sp. SCA2-2 TaxID=1563677 RepID=UPI00102230CC|nr:hypothetical protein [Streptomyces sp. SCA2-2]RZF03556.1 hypothetical protein C0L86_05515 [Streptomyces sp. SCA2-2]
MTNRAQNTQAAVPGEGAIPFFPLPAKRDLAHLPGPRRHLERLERDLRTGVNCVWYFPDTMVDSGRAEFFLRELMSRLEESLSVPGAIMPTEHRSRATDTGANPLPAQRSGSVLLENSSSPADLSDPWHEEEDGFFDADDPYGALLGSAGTPPPTGPSITREAGLPVPLADRLAKELGVESAPLNELLRRARRSRGTSDTDNPEDSDDGSADTPPTVVVRGWEEQSAEEMGSLLRAAHATFRESGLSAEHRPRFLFAARIRDLPNTVLGAGLGHNPVTTHWWWRVWTRLDSEVLLAWRSDSPAGADQALPDRVADAVVAEVCGPDVDRTLLLRGLWKGGDVESLRRALAATLPAQAADGRQKRPHRMSTAHASSPSAEVLDAWADGSIDSWDGRVRPVLAHRLLDTTSGELSVLVCHAQNRVLLPLLEEARTSLIDLVPSLLRKGISLDYFCQQAQSDHRVKNKLPAASLAELEIGDLARAARLLVLTTEQRERLKDLKRARNLLSHLQPLSQGHLNSVTQALTTDWVGDN